MRGFHLILEDDGYGDVQAVNDLREEILEAQKAG